MIPKVRPRGFGLSTSGSYVYQFEGNNSSYDVRLRESVIRSGSANMRGQTNAPVHGNTFANTVSVVDLVKSGDIDDNSEPSSSKVPAETTDETSAGGGSF
mmetsp:Transcript_51293/g.154142  ORF Transcript_51293/g.154142 Transcript_51293/m.154142 type:complete len:100 (+) Transcript_51293:923-1222(+)